MGWEVYQSVLGLEVVANGIADTGRTFNHWVDAFRSTAGGVPVLGSSFRDLASTLQRSAGDPLIGSGAEAHRRISQLATVLGLVTAIVPIFASVATYGAWRWRDARRMTSAAAFVQAAERSGRTEEASAVLGPRGGAPPDHRHPTGEKKIPWSTSATSPTVWASRPSTAPSSRVESEMGTSSTAGVAPIPTRGWPSRAP